MGVFDQNQASGSLYNTGGYDQKVWDAASGDPNTAAQLQRGIDSGMYVLNDDGVFNADGGPMGGTRITGSQRYREQSQLPQWEQSYGQQGPQATGNQSGSKFDALERMLESSMSNRGIMSRGSTGVGHIRDPLIRRSVFMSKNFDNAGDANAWKAAGADYGNYKQFQNGGGQPSQEEGGMTLGEGPYAGLSEVERKWKELGNEGEMPQEFSTDFYSQRGYKHDPNTANTLDKWTQNGTREAVVADVPPGAGPGPLTGTTGPDGQPVVSHGPAAGPPGGGKGGGNTPPPWITNAVSQYGGGKGGGQGGGGKGGQAPPPTEASPPAPAGGGSMWDQREPTLPPQSHEQGQYAGPYSAQNDPNFDVSKGRYTTRPEGMTDEQWQRYGPASEGMSFIPEGGPPPYMGPGGKGGGQRDLTTFNPNEQPAGTQPGWLGHDGINYSPDPNFVGDRGPNPGQHSLDATQASYDKWAAANPGQASVMRMDLTQPWQEPQKWNPQQPQMNTGAMLNPWQSQPGGGYEYTGANPQPLGGKGGGTPSTQSYTPATNLSAGTGPLNSAQPLPGSALGPGQNSGYQDPNAVGPQGGTAGGKGGGQQQQSGKGGGFG